MLYSFQNTSYKHHRGGIKMGTILEIILNIIIPIVAVIYIIKATKELNEIKQELKQIKGRLHEDQ